MQSFAAALSSVNTLITAPFRTKLPLMPIFLLFLLVMILAAQWRLIVDRIEADLP